MSVFQGPSNYNDKIQIRLSKEDHKRLKEAANKSGMTMSSYIKFAVNITTEFLEKNN
ncbi:MAG: plasmid mobilization protein [Romboutsia timonensis]